MSNFQHIYIILNSHFLLFQNHFYMRKQYISNIHFWLYKPNLQSHHHIIEIQRWISDPPAALTYSPSSPLEIIIDYQSSRSSATQYLLNLLLRYYRDHHRHKCNCKGELLLHRQSNIHTYIYLYIYIYSHHHIFIDHF